MKQRKVRARTAAQAAYFAAQQQGYELPQHVTEAIAEAVLAHFDDVEAVREHALRPNWEDPQYRQYIRQSMRRKLIAGIADEGRFPSGLPAETVTYHSGAFGEVEVPHELAASGQADWNTVTVTLSVGVRTPAIDRSAAVRAGLLNTLADR